MDKLELKMFSHTYVVGCVCACGMVQVVRNIRHKQLLQSNFKGIQACQVCHGENINRKVSLSIITIFVASWLTHSTRHQELSESVFLHTNIPRNATASSIVIIMEADYKAHIVFYLT